MTNGIKLAMIPGLAITQITAAGGDLYALCNDGSVWAIQWSGHTAVGNPASREWVQISPSTTLSAVPPPVV